MLPNCKTCNLAIPADNIDIDTWLAHCPNCHTVFNVTPISAKEKPDTPLLDAPTGFFTEHDEKGLHIVYKWRNDRVIVQYIMIWIGISFMLWIYANSHQDNFTQLLSGTIFVLFSILAIYSTLFTLLNRTHIQINEKHLTVHHEPLFGMGNCIVAREQIKQVYVVQLNYGNGKHSKYSQTQYRLKAVLHDSPNVILLGYLRNLTDGLYIEQQIERFLGIRDMRVIDEFIPELN